MRGGPGGARRPGAPGRPTGPGGTRTAGPARRAAGRFAVALALASLATLSCDDPPTSSGLLATPRVERLEAVEGADQVFFSGRRSPRAFAVRALDGHGGPVSGALVEFSLEGGAGGTLSQPRAVADREGRAETFVLEGTPGEGVLSARAGEARVELPFRVDRGPGEIRFLQGSGEVGLPGLPHPDSLIRVQVVDTEGEPLEGAVVWFATGGVISSFNDTTDARGMASTVLRRSALRAGSQPVFAFMPDFQELTVQTDRPTAAVAERVVLVSVDGLRADALERFQPPVLARLAAEGAHTVEARTVVPSLTVPAHLSMFSGVSPATHGVFNDQIRLTPEMARLDPIFRRAHEDGRVSAAFVSREGPLRGFEAALECKLAFGLDSLTLVASDGLAVADTAGPALADPSLDLVFVHLPDPDLAGHAHGWSSAEYGDAVLRADSALGRIVQRAVEPSEAVLVIVVSDHGGGGAYGDFQHGSTSPEDMLIPIVLWGSGVLAGRDLGPASILDVAPTVLWALGIEPPGDYEGEILTGGFY